MDADFLTIRRHHSRLPGEGDLDVAGFLRAVLVTGYTGPISVEILFANPNGLIMMTLPHLRQAFRVRVALSFFCFQAESTIAAGNSEARD